VTVRVTIRVRAVYTWLTTAPFASVPSPNIQWYESVWPASGSFEVDPSNVIG
jgi:hypothetical protein